MNSMKRYTTLAFALAILTPWYAPGAQEETVNVDIEVERIIEEAKEGDGNKIVIVRKEERETKAPEPLGMNVTLEFTLEGSGRSFSVTTATTNFMLSSEQSSQASERIMHEDFNDEEFEEEEFEEEEEEEFDDQEHEEEYEVATAESYTTTESHVSIAGSLQLLEEATLLIRCAGAFIHQSRSNEEREEAAEEADTSSLLNFETSAMMRPGETRTLVTQGPLRLVLRLATD
jgi:hypothetical protein